MSEVLSENYGNINVDLKRNDAEKTASTEWYSGKASVQLGDILLEVPYTFTTTWDENSSSIHEELEAVLTDDMDWPEELQDADEQRLKSISRKIEVAMKESFDG